MSSEKLKFFREKKTKISQLYLKLRVLFIELSVDRFVRMTILYDE